MNRAILGAFAALAAACSDATSLHGADASSGGGSRDGAAGPVESGPGAADARAFDVVVSPGAEDAAAVDAPDAPRPPDATVDASDGAPGAVPLWNGVDLSDWDGDTAVWRVADGAIVGSAADGAVTVNTFLVYRPRLFGDFVLRAQIWLGAPGNSGIQFRSSRLSPSDFRVAGYQADVGEGYWGALYDERGRGILQEARPACTSSGRYGEWLDYEIEARGPAITVRLGGIECVSFAETDSSRPREGILALQYHVPGGFEVRFRDLLISR